MDKTQYRYRNISQTLLDATQNVARNFTLLCRSIYIPALFFALGMSIITYFAISSDHSLEGYAKYIIPLSVSAVMTLVAYVWLHSNVMAWLGVGKVRSNIIRLIQLYVIVIAVSYGIKLLFSSFFISAQYSDNATIDEIQTAMGNAATTNSLLMLASFVLMIIIFLPYSYVVIRSLLQKKMPYKEIVSYYIISLKYWGRYFTVMVIAFLILTVIILLISLPLIILSYAEIMTHYALMQGDASTLPPYFKIMYVATTFLTTLIYTLIWAWGASIEYNIFSTIEHKRHNLIK